MLVAQGQAIAGPDSEYFGTNTQGSSSQSQSSDYFGSVQDADENQRQNMQGITGYGGRKRAEEARRKWLQGHQGHFNNNGGTSGSGGLPPQPPGGGFIGAGGGGEPPDPKKWAETHEATTSYPDHNGDIVLVWMVPGYGVYKKTMPGPHRRPKNDPPPFVVTVIDPKVKKTPPDIKAVMKTRPTQICAERTQELKEGLEAQGINGKRCTMAASVLEQNGERFIVITSSDGQAHGLVRPWEIFDPGAMGNDAEIRAINFAQAHLACRLIACGATNYVCEKCEDALNDIGVKIATPTLRNSWRNQNKRLFPK